ncbi:MAG TPA: hypothetical protein VK819_07195 [Acidobacteriaceae bacterium]|nr:hypothetical protein [Acidobacteriaceae bacterium]
MQGKEEPDLMQHLFSHFDLEEIALPMGQNGYFDEEPLVAIPKDLPEDLAPKSGQLITPDYFNFLSSPNTHFTVVEGNRRLATARILRDEGLRQQLKVRNWPNPSTEVLADLEQLPVIIYPTRKEVLPYLGVRHITGNKKWDSYAKARYISSMIDEGYSVYDIEQEVGDRSQGVLKNAISYKLLEQAKTELDLDISRAKEDFSYLLLGIGQRNIKIFLGWIRPTQKLGETKALPLSEVSLEAPIPDSHLANLKDFLSWVYGEGNKVLPVIKESRDITNYLSHVVGSENAVSYLRKTRNLIEAYDLTNGEESMVRSLLGTANTKLEKALGVVHRHKTADVIAEAEKCVDTSSRILKTVQER